MSKDMDDVVRRMDRTRSGRIAKHGGGFPWGTALILILGALGLIITALIAGINTIV